MGHESSVVRNLCASGDDAGIATFLGSILDKSTANHIIIDVGIALRSNGKSALALRVFHWIMDAWPDWAAGYYEAAFLHRLEGNHLEAARLLIEAHQRQPNDVRISIFLIHILHAIGAHQTADQHYERAILLADGPAAQQLEEIRQFGAYLSAWPKPKALEAMKVVQASFGYHGTSEVAEQVIKAVKARRPFALIRLGDGEGGCINLGLEDERRYELLYQRNRRELTAMWFGNDFPWNGREFRDIVERLPNIALECDYIGVPYEGWIQHEYRISSLRGVPSLNNVHRAFQILGQSFNESKCCSQLVHMDLSQSGGLESIIRSTKQLSVISCLPELPELLRRRFDLDEVNFYRIPGERGSQTALGDDAVFGTHFPDAYHDTLARLQVPHDGRLFLIAGGILGKFYAATVKRFGGIALDVGSVADGWARKITRPGMDASMGL